jgi:signal transduction histidine kinase
MMTAPTPQAIAPRAGTDWYRALAPEARLPLLTGLVSRINHDMRTPLNTLAGWTHLLQQGTPDAARTRHVAEVFARNVRDQTVLLEEFVDDARALTQVLALDCASLPAAEVLTAATERLATALDVHDVRLDLHAALGDVTLDTDRARATRLVYRVLLAAVRRAPPGAVLRAVARADGGAAVIEAVAPAARPTLDDALLLDLRIASAVAALLGASLEVDAGERETRLALRLPPAS